MSRRPAALDALLDPGFFGPVDAKADVASRLDPEAGFEAAMDQARRLRGEIAFRIGVKC